MPTIIREAIDAGYQLSIEQTDGGYLVQLTGRNVHEGTAQTFDDIVEVVFNLRADADSAGDAPDRQPAAAR